VILDSSALVAAVQREPGHEELEEKMRSADVLAIGAPTLVETEIVVMRANGRSARGLVSRIREQLDVVVIPFDQAHVEVAARAFQRFGKGRHPASLNYGDCMTYATALLAEWPLLFKGNDFARTDIDAA
jgi:ribonuclease VapC